MSPKQPSKQKRAAQNRNQRAARVARAANANAAPRTVTPASTTTAGSGGGSLLSRLRGGSMGGRSTSPSASTPTSPRPARVGATRAAGGALRPQQPPGYRAALSAVLAAAAAAMLCSVALRYPVDAQGNVYTPETVTADWSLTALRATIDQPDATPATVVDSIDVWMPDRTKATVAKALWPYSLAIALPLIGSGLGFHAVRKRSSSKIVNRALYATLFGAVLTQGLLMLFLPAVIAMGLAMFQVRKAETIAAVSGADGVIEADVIEDDLEDDAGR